jgi:outer membrane protein assembly factor BamB
VPKSEKDGPLSCVDRSEPWCPSKAMTTRSVIAIVCLWVAAPSLLAHDWPQWRGPQSNGVAVVSRAPERWSSSQGVSWRAEIEGSGISSPVVVGTRVYVTTAIASQRRTMQRLACDSLIACLAIVGVPALVWYRRRLTRATSLEAHSAHWLVYAVRTLDSVQFVLLSFVILVCGVLMALGPTAVDVGLNVIRDAAVAVARWLGRSQTNLSFLIWDEGTSHTTWIISSAISMASLAIAPFLLLAYPGLRLAGACVLFSGVVFANAYVPWPTAYGDQYPTSVLIVLYTPVIALGSWHLLAALVSRFKGGWSDKRLTTSGWLLVFSVPGLLSITLLASPNYFHQQHVVIRRVICLDTGSGQRLWHTDVFATPPEPKSGLNSHATPTPTVVGNTIVVAFGLGIASLDTDGDVRWSKTFPNWTENAIYGAGSSPVADDTAVFLTHDREFEASQPSRVVAYSLATGNELWSISPEFAHDGYATPILHDDGTRKLLITVTSRTLVGYDIASGEVAWKLAIPVAQPVPSLVAVQGKLYVTGRGGGTAHTAAYRLRQSAAPEELWRSHRNSADVASPVLYKGRLYTITSTGILVSYEAETGRVVWRKRLGAGLATFHASLVAADNKVYAASSNGTTFVIAAEDEFRLISESTLSEDMSASPAFAADCLFLRTVSALYCIKPELHRSASGA